MFPQHLRTFSAEHAFQQPIQRTMFRLEILTFLHSQLAAIQWHRELTLLLGDIGIVAEWGSSSRPVPCVGEALASSAGYRRLDRLTKSEAGRC